MYKRQAKGNNAVAAGAIGTIVVNNAAGTINMSTDGYTGTAPYVSLTLADGLIIKANAEKKEANGVTYYVGKLTVGAKPGVNVQTADYYTMSDFSSWGIPGSLEMKPEITAPGGNIYSLQNGGGYQNMSGTSMASPQVAGMAAVVAQYIRANKLTEKTGLTARALAQSLLMSTAVPMYQDYGEGKYGYYSVMQQGAGLANVGAAVSAGTYIKMDKNANAGAADGKVKVELGDDPGWSGSYDLDFRVENLGSDTLSYSMKAVLLRPDTAEQDGKTMVLASDVLIREVDLGSVSVPAGGTQVSRTVSLTASDIAAIRDLFPNGSYPHASTPKEPTYYEIPPEALKDEAFAAMIAEAEKYVGYPYVWGGSSPSTSFDCSGFISWVINHSGWNVGRQTAQGLYNICTPVSPEQAKPGDLVFFVGTYDTARMSHVGLYVGNSVMLHCGDPISYTNLNSSYWQQHFYCYGRLP